MLTTRVYKNKLELDINLLYYLFLQSQYLGIK